MKFSLKNIFQPDILTGVGMGNMLAGTGLAVGATPEAMRRLEKRKIKEGKRKLTVGEMIETALPCYIPSALATLLGMTCIIVGTVQRDQQNAYLATACSIAQAGLQEYQSKVVETIGEKKERAMRDDIIRDRMEKNPPPSDMVINEPTGAWGQTLFYDVASGRYFHKDLETLRRAANKLNWHMTTKNERYISLNDWYMEIDMSPIYPLGEDNGWNPDKGLIEIRTVEHRMPNGAYCTGITFENEPFHGYDEL